MNKIILLGRLVNDPELKYSETGTATARFSLAVTRDTDRNKADFFFCIAFGKLGQALADHCRKGRQLLLDGRLEINQVPGQDGQMKTYINVIAQGIEFLAKPQTGQQQPAGQQPDQRPDQSNNQQPNNNSGQQQHNQRPDQSNNQQPNNNSGQQLIDTGQDPRNTEDYQGRFY